MILKKLIGKTMHHPDLGKVKVLGVVPKSRTKVEVKMLDRGKGWDDWTKSYKGHRNTVGWMRGENREYNSTDEVHFKTLK